MLTHAGDAGAIGRVVCTSSGPSADGYAVARVSSRPPDKPRQARKGKAAVSKAGAAAAGADGSDNDAAVSSESLDEEEDGESDSQSNQEGIEAALGSDEVPPSGIPALDLKGKEFLETGCCRKCLGQWDLVSLGGGPPGRIAGTPQPVHSLPSQRAAKVCFAGRSSQSNGTSTQEGSLQDGRCACLLHETGVNPTVSMHSPSRGWFLLQP